MQANQAAGLGVIVAMLVGATAAASPVRDPPILSGDALAFPRGGQNEPAIAVDPSSGPDPLLAVGANDYQDQLPCFASTCTFTPGIGISGISFSLDGGNTWTRPQRAPEYVGWTGRSGTVRRGKIATVPRFDDRRLSSHGDPALAFGPRPLPGGGFSWRAGSRLYYASLGRPFFKPLAAKAKPPFQQPPFQRVAVSSMDDAAAAASGVRTAWRSPVVLSGKTAGDRVADKPAVWADNAESSPFFGRVYACWSSFPSWEREERVRAPGGSPRPILFSTSANGGSSWSRAIALPRIQAARGRQACAIRTDSKGAVYVFWQEFPRGRSRHVMTRSSDGGRTFGTVRVVAQVVDVGRREQDRLVFDGIGGARTNSWPSVDIANGAPGGHAEDVIVLAWADGRRGLNREEALLRYSRNGGQTWSAAVNVAAPGDRPDFPAIAISPNGRSLYVVYTGFGPFQTTVASRRPMRGVMRAASFAEVATQGANARWFDIAGPVGDARGSSNTSVTAEFIGDYNSVAATDRAGYAAWVDASTARDCPTINGFRERLARSKVRLRRPPPLPRGIRARCKLSFGNTGGAGAVIPATEIPGSRIH